MSAATADQFLHAANHCIIGNGTWYTPEAVARLAAEQGSCVWHAAHTLMIEHLADLGYGTCPICEGVTAPERPVHQLCRARAERGLPTPQLDASPTCPCAKCAPR